MGKLKFLLPAVAAVAALVFTSCNKNDNTDPGPYFELRFVGFEDAELNGNGVLLDQAYAEQGLTFTHNYTATETGYYWNGFAVSDNTDMKTSGYLNQYSVYGDGGFGGSANFGVACLYGNAEITLPEGELRFFDYAYITNTTYPYLAIKDGRDGPDEESHIVKGPFGNGDWFKLTITGYDAKGDETASKEVYLADFRDGKKFIMSEWTKVSLNLFGEVNKISFSLSSTDNGEYGMNTPAYFCIDNIACREYHELE